MIATLDNDKYGASIPMSKSFTFTVEVNPDCPATLLEDNPDEYKLYCTSSTPVPVPVAAAEFEGVVIEEEKEEIEEL